MAPPTSNRKRLLIVSAIVVAAVLLLIVSTFLGNKAPKKTASSSAGKTTTTLDKNSGDSTSTISGENNSYGTTPGVPIFLGANNLISNGLTTQQLQAMETDFYDYSIAQKLNTAQVSISSNVILGVIAPGTNNQVATMTFNVVLDNTTTLKAELQYTGLYNVDLQLSNAAGTQVYDSGNSADNSGTQNQGT